MGQLKLFLGEVLCRTSCCLGSASALCAALKEPSVVEESVVTLPPRPYVRQLFFCHLLPRFSPTRKRGQTSIATVMPGKARASPSTSIASSTISMKASISMSPFSTSPLIQRDATPPTRSICSTFLITSTTSCQIVSRNLTSLKSPQTGASAASTSSPCGRKLLRNWRRWVRTRPFGSGEASQQNEAGEKFSAHSCSDHLQLWKAKFRPQNASEIYPPS